MADQLFVASRKGLLDYRRSGAAWKLAGSHFLGSPVSMVLPLNGGQRIFAALNLGHFGVKLHRSDDGGKSWTELAAPAYPKFDAGEGSPVAEGGKAPSVSQIWSLESAGAGKPEQFWCGTMPGGLFHSADAGATWALVEPLWDWPERERWFGGGADLPGIHSICVDPRRSDRVAIAVSCGGVCLTEDSGKTWKVASHGMWAEYMPPEMKNDPVIQDPHRMAQCPGAPGTWWVQHHNGIFRSTDDLKSWHEITTAPVSNFGFPVAVHPRDPEIAWFVPAVDDGCRVPVNGRMVVQRTSNGGRSFDVLSRGLPQDDAFDLVYRHGLAIDETGNRLAMGSTTGSLWISEDGGEGWTLLSTHLPPINAVRFG